MGRQIRRVPMGWQHPKDVRGHYKPLHDKTHEDRMREYEADKARFEADPEEQAIARSCGCLTFAQWDGEPPDPEYYRPKWDEGVTLGYCFYENVTEGTPLSPVFETPEQLVEWLIQKEGLRPEAARSFVSRGWASTLVLRPGQSVERGIDVADEI